MTKEEAGKIVGVLTFNYPDTLRDKSDEALTSYIENWHFFFKDDSYAEVMQAVQKIIASSQERFAPNVGMIREQMRKNRTPQGGMSEQEAWGLVKQALRNGSYGYKEEFAKLPPIIQRCVGSENMIREWAVMDSDTLDSVVASNFMRSYRAIRESAEEEARTPESIRQQLEAFRDNFLIGIDDAKPEEEKQVFVMLEAAKEEGQKQKQEEETTKRPAAPVMPKLDSMYVLASEEETEQMRREQFAKLDAMFGG